MPPFICHWKELKAQKPERGGGAVYLKKVKPLDGLLHGHPSQRKADDPGLPHQKADRVDPRTEREFNKVFM